MQAMEFGIHTGELNNLQSLTPQVFRADRKAKWSTMYEAAFPTNNATEANARYCLDRAVSIVLKKQEHAGVSRQPLRELHFDPPPIYIDRVVYEGPDTNSKQVHLITEDYHYTIHRVVGGFDPTLTFYQITAESKERTKDSLLDLPARVTKGFLEILQEDAE